MGLRKIGKVWLVGAGPGDAGLFTRKGYEVLQQADVVVYDALVGDGVLSLVPRNVRTIDVGKRAANHTMPQEQISQVLLDEALAGNNVVRLKGGDPFVFGRGGEELELLAEYGVPYEVVPGITSAVAVPAYNGIPITHRDFTSSFHVITGHKRAGADYDIDFDALIRAKGTLVFLMGVRSCPDIMAGLMNAGMDPDTPAAILQEGTTAGQRRVVATVATLADEATRAGIAAPAIIVVGGVCGLADQFAWYEELPLAGCKVVVTRPAELVSTMSDRLRKLGAEVLEIPAIATVPIEDNDALKCAFERIALYDWIVFTSPSGVRIFFDEAVKASVDHRLIKGQVAALARERQTSCASVATLPTSCPKARRARRSEQRLRKWRSRVRRSSSRELALAIKRLWMRCRHAKSTTCRRTIPCRSTAAWSTWPASSQRGVSSVWRSPALRAFARSWKRISTSIPRWFAPPASVRRRVPRPRVSA